MFDYLLSCIVSLFDFTPWLCYQDTKAFEYGIIDQLGKKG